MLIVEISQQPNGSHRNRQVAHASPVPAGWARWQETNPLPEGFPFGSVEVSYVADTAFVSKWDPLPLPVPDPDPAPEPSVWDELDAAYVSGVNSVN